MPAAGAGNIEVDFAKDIYTFTVGAGQRIVFEVQDVVPTLTFVAVRLLAPDKRVIFSDSLSFGSDVYTLPVAGSYALVIGDDSDERTGTYRFRLSSPPTPQQFTIALGARVSDGVPAAGAGNIEAPFGQDSYTFNATKGQSIVVEVQSLTAALNDVPWRLVGPSGNFYFNDPLGSGDQTPSSLFESGTYTIIVGGTENPAIGTYSFQIRLE